MSRNITNEQAKAIFGHLNEFRLLSSHEPHNINKVRKNAPITLIKAIQEADNVTTGGKNKDLFTLENIRDVHRIINRNNNTMQGSGFIDDVGRALGEVGKGVVAMAPSLIPIALSLL